MPNDYIQNLFGLDGQTAVVIGGTGVLGGALCDGIAQAGAFVVVAGRSIERGEKRVAAIKELGGDAAFVPVDATMRSSVEQLLATVKELRGGVEMLVNCAGVNKGTSYEDVSDEDWHRVMTGNLTATHIACQTFAPAMSEQKQGGAILNIGSITARTPLSRVFAYSASKAAVVNLTKNIAQEYATRGVRVNALCPGFFPAEQNEKILTPERVDSIMTQTPMNRYGEPRELIGAVLLLLSSQAGSFITGTEVFVDGGFTGYRF